MNTYRHAENINLNHPLEVEKLNSTLQIIVNRSANAFIETGNDDPRFCNLIGDILQTFWSTHKSICILMSHAAADKNLHMGIGADAMSLAREQVEKIYLLSLLLEDRDKWVNEYLRDDWRKQYEMILLSKEEHQDLPNHKEFVTTYAPQELEKMRIATGITDEEKEAIEFKFLNPDLKEKQWPTHIRGKLIEVFPTPKGVIKVTANSQVEKCLKRWYLEYTHLCTYTHIGLNKIATQSATKRISSKDDLEKYFFNNLEPSQIISYVSVLSACTEVYRHITPNADVLAELTKLWTELEKGSLLGKVFWNLQAKAILKII